MAAATISPNAQERATNPPATTRPRWRRIAGWLVRAAERFLAIFGLLVLVWVSSFRLSTMISSSMSPTLQGTAWENGDVVLTEKVSFRFRRPRRWEIVSYTQHGGEVMKRVVGFPGERVQMRSGGRIFINGQELTRPKELEGIRFYAFGNLTAGQIADCGDGYYVLGDDSRDSDEAASTAPCRPSKSSAGRG